MLLKLILPEQFRQDAWFVSAGLHAADAPTDTFEFSSAVIAVADRLNNVQFVLDLPAQLQLISQHAEGKISMIGIQPFCKFDIMVDITDLGIHKAEIIQQFFFALCRLIQKIRNL